ncbi:unnamed protein product [Fusarium venenatum]|uniref:Uncharacterized protein n=1 Tax=Fusarium venenatum TaxID=56646 RepID=A0A2L2T1H9_9HYPO|nr:uncharacterized protein FVRRES_00936 [Fusarium venenatum]CEI64424.1 unnamed protein product [Fusarium venenatum]
MAESVQTHPAGPPGLAHAGPMLTTLAAIDERDVIHGRKSQEICGYYNSQSPTVKTLFESSHSNLIRNLQ